MNLNLDIEKNNDGGVFANSDFGNNLQSCKLNISEDSPLSGTNTIALYMILGDDCFITV